MFALTDILLKPSTFLSSLITSPEPEIPVNLIQDVAIIKMMVTTESIPAIFRSIFIFLFMSYSFAIVISPETEVILILIVPYL